MTASRHDRLAETYDDSTAKWLVDRADRRYWALYRILDASQSDVRGLVQTRADASQATVSRAINNCDTRALTDPDLLTLGGDLDVESIKQGEYPEEWFEAYRDVLARAVVDRMALKIIAHENKTTPEWAARRFPELVGSHHHVARHWNTAEPKIADETHLNHLESVNIDRWK